MKITIRDSSVTVSWWWNRRVVRIFARSDEKREQLAITFREAADKLEGEVEQA